MEYLSLQDVAGQYLVVHRPNKKDFLQICEVEVENDVMQINVVGMNMPEWVDLTAINDGKLTSCSILGWRMWPADGIIQLGQAVSPFKQAEVQLYSLGIDFQSQK